MKFRRIGLRSFELWSLLVIQWKWVFRLYTEVHCCSRRITWISSRCRGTSSGSWEFCSEVCKSWTVRTQRVVTWEHKSRTMRTHESYHKENTKGLNCETYWYSTVIFTRTVPWKSTGNFTKVVPWNVFIMLLSVHIIPWTLIVIPGNSHAPDHEVYTWCAMKYYTLKRGISQCLNLLQWPRKFERVVDYPGFTPLRRCRLCLGVYYTSSDIFFFLF